MAKGQKKSNREAKKPKKVKAPATGVPTGLAAQVQGLQTKTKPAK